MRSHAQQPQCGTALQQYERCVHILQKELQIEPEAATTVLYQAIRAVTLPVKSYTAFHRTLAT